MRAIVVYESVYGNTRAIAEAIADALGALALTTEEAPPDGDAARADLLVVGGPTHVHGVASARTLEAGAGESELHGPALRDWLDALPRASGALAAAFDTRLDKAQWLTGAASRGLAKRLDRQGFSVVSTASFLVTDSDGPLLEGELERARQWGAELAALVPAAGAPAPAER
jgi:glutathione S-transferase